MGRPSNFITVKEVSNALSFAYIGALSLIAIFTYISHIITDGIMEQQKVSAQVSYNLGTQRTLVQQITFNVQNYKMHGNKVDLSLLKTAIDDLKSVQAQVKGSIQKAGFLTQLIGHNYTSEALYSIYYNSPNYLDTTISTFLEKASKYHEQASREAKNSPSDKNIEYKPAFLQDERIKNSMREKGELNTAKTFESYVEVPKHLQQDYIKMFFPTLDLALSEYQKETFFKIQQYYQLQFYAMISILILLSLEAFFIFRPLVNRIHRYNSILRRQAFEDELTGLNNRRAFMEYAQTALNDAHKENKPIAVALMDLDKFKSVNDTYGHDVGDIVLQHFSKMLKSFLRSQDIIGRIGGEEFVIVLTETEQGKALKILERLREKIEKSPCRHKGSDGKSASLSYTTSMGVSIPQKGKKPPKIDELLKQADEALYKSKEDGRNRITLAEQTNTPKISENQNAEKEQPQATEAQTTPQATSS